MPYGIYQRVKPAWNKGTHIKTNTGKTHFKKGFTPWNKGMKGLVNSGSFQKGHSQSNTGKTHFKKGIKPWSTGLKMTKELIEKNRISHLGQPAWNKGIKGQKSHSWKGGITEKNQLERVRFRKTIQKEVFKRDDYTCQLCGAKRNLTVDHIQSWAEYVDLRFNIENCRTLCAECHYQVTFGKPMPIEVKSWGHNLSQGGIYRG